MVSERLKNIIFKRLYKELSKVEIIPNQDSVYFIDRDKKYWYFEYEINSGKLWWRYDFFINFFVLFSLAPYDYEKVMGEWVEEVLNCKVHTTHKLGIKWSDGVEEVLNCKVLTTASTELINLKAWKRSSTVRYSQTQWDGGLIVTKVEDVLNHKVEVTMARITDRSTEVEEVLNSDTVL